MHCIQFCLVFDPGEGQQEQDALWPTVRDADPYDLTRVRIMPNVEGLAALQGIPQIVPRQGCGVDQVSVHR